MKEIIKKDIYRTNDERAILKAPFVAHYKISHSQQREKKSGEAENGFENKMKRTREREKETVLERINSTTLQHNKCHNILNVIRYIQNYDLK